MNIEDLQNCFLNYRSGVEEAQYEKLKLKLLVERSKKEGVSNKELTNRIYNFFRSFSYEFKT